MATEPLLALAALGLTHVVTLPLVLLLPRSPAPHAADGHAQPEPDDVDERTARRMLVLFRTGLASSYVLMASIAPLLPHVLGALGLTAAAKTPMAAIWMTARVGMFLVMERWHGWHGRYRTAVWAGALMCAGAALTLTSPLFGEDTGRVIIAAGLVALGSGVGAVYAAAIYYAMHAGPAAVDSGGKHEAMIGVGYTVGPFVALAIGSAFGLFFVAG
jgi:MFS family permease